MKANRGLGSAMLDAVSAAERVSVFAPKRRPWWLPLFLSACLAAALMLEERIARPSEGLVDPIPQPADEPNLSPCAVGDVQGYTWTGGERWR